MEKKYTKLSDLVGSTFTVEKAWGYSWKKWDAESKRMLLAEKYEEGYSKVYSLETDQGKLDVRAGQLSSLLEATYDKGSANIVGRTFQVKSNGKTGMDIRYYFNAARDTAPVQVAAPVAAPASEEDEIGDEPINLDDIPF